MIPPGKSCPISPRAARMPPFMVMEVMERAKALEAEGREIIHLEVESVQTSCGYAVPRYYLRQGRNTLTRWAEKKGPEGIAEYQRQRNATSIDVLTTGLFDDDGE